MRTVIACVVIWFAVAGAGALFAAQTPKSEKEIPIIGGAARDAAAEAELKEQSAWDQNPGIRSAVEKVYKTGASPEEVFGFYLQKIGGKEGMWEGDPQTIAPGAASPVMYEITYYDDTDLTDYPVEGGTHPGSRMKQNLAKNRKPHKSGMWVKEVGYSWAIKEANGDISGFYLNILDTSFDTSDYPTVKYKTGTQIMVQVITEKSAEAVQEEAFENMDKETAAYAKTLKGKPPTEKDLGVPIYPGASFDAENSAGMSAGNDFSMYIYLSGDQPSKVAAFYEQKLKIKPMQVENRYMIPLKGKLPLPEEGISIEPNTMFGGPAKTVITIQKTARGEE